MPSTGCWWTLPVPDWGSFERNPISISFFLWGWRSQEITSPLPSIRMAYPGGEGVTVQPHPWLADCLLLSRTGNLERLTAFQKGLRRTPLTIPAARGFLQCLRVSSTEPFTAALWGILSRKSI